MINRRKLMKYTAGAAASTSLMGSVFAADDSPIPKSNRFLLYIHFGSACGIASGLVQPVAPGKWPKGFFQEGAEAGSTNPLLNSHVAAQGLIFHDYLKFLAPIAKDMCLVNGTPQSLDHNVARVLQKRGATQGALAPEWGMGLTENMKTAERRNPMIVTEGTKSRSTADITLVKARSLDELKTITTDNTTIPKTNVDPIWAALKNRFKAASSAAVNYEANLAETANHQLDTLIAGLAPLGTVKAETDSLRAALDRPQITALVAGCADKIDIMNQFDNNFKEELVLAGILAKTGLANGMTIEALDDDNHVGGADVSTARRAANRWAMISQFWGWIRSMNLQNDVMIVVGQEFSRSPYNITSEDLDIVGLDGKKIRIKSPGRDHGVSMGTLFINANVPSGGRIGTVGGNLVPQATKDSKGTVDTSLTPFTSENIVGSMFLRVFPELFPSERIVRGHWPTFKEVAAILA